MKGMQHKPPAGMKPMMKGSHPMKASTAKTTKKPGSGSSKPRRKAGAKKG